MRNEMEWDRRRRIEDRELLKESGLRTGKRKVTAKETLTATKRTLGQLKKSGDALAKADSVLKRSSPVKDVKRRWYLTRGYSGRQRSGKPR